MGKVVLVLLSLAIGAVVGGVYVSRMDSTRSAQSVPSDSSEVLTKGGQEQTGHYQVVRGWPKPISSWPGHEKWTGGAHQGIFAESPNRVIVIQRGELPNLPRPVNTPVPQFGPSFSFPVNQVPYRNASQGPVASPPTGGGTGGIPGPGSIAGKDGVDHRWEHCIYIVDAEGNMVDSWTQWDSMMLRPHSVFISPYDPEKHVWVVDDGQHQIYKFSNDGKTLVQSLGTRGEPGDDDKHFNRPTFLAWQDDGTLYVADGYNGTRVAKYDKDGKFLMTWGERGERGKETRPNYFNSVHGIAVDPKTRRVFVNDRENHRIQVFDENGKFLDMWTIGEAPAHIYTMAMSGDGYLWGSDAGTFQLVKWDLNGKYQYSWGYLGDAPGAIFAAHQFSVDQEGNFYVAETAGGRAQKFRPLRGADPAKLISRLPTPAWQ